MDCTIVGDVIFDLVLTSNPSDLQLIHGGVAYCPELNFKLGGSGNVAVGLSKLGCNVQFIGKVGKDFLGEYYENNLKLEGITTNILFDKFHATGVALTFLDANGERSFLISRGANDGLLSEEVRAFKTNIANSKFLYVCGFSLVNNPQREAIVNAVEIAKSVGVKVVFDPGSYNLVKQNLVLFKKLLNVCDVFTPNLLEARAITNFHHVDDMAAKFAESVPLTVVKKGKGGCTIINSEKTINVKPELVTCLDSSGAGDAFVSALIFGLINNFPIMRIAKFANWFAACVIQNIGPRSFPEKEEINKKLLQFIE